jgi:hypothetical protein
MDSRTRARRYAYQAIQTRRGHIGRVGPIRYVVYGANVVVEQSRGAKRERDGSRVSYEDHHVDTYYNSTCVSPLTLYISNGYKT